MMKNFKRLLLAFVAVFAAVLLVACGDKSDNGTYVFEPSKEEAVKMLPEELQGLAGDGINVKISIAIHGEFQVRLSAEQLESILTKELENF